MQNIAMTLYYITQIDIVGVDISKLVECIQENDAPNSSQIYCQSQGYQNRMSPKEWPLLQIFFREEKYTYLTQNYYNIVSKENINSFNKSFSLSFYPSLNSKPSRTLNSKLSSTVAVSSSPRISNKKGGKVRTVSFVTQPKC